MIRKYYLPIERVDVYVLFLHLQYFIINLITYSLRH